MALHRNTFGLSHAFRRVVASVRDRQNRLKVTSGKTWTAKPTVYFLTPDYQQPAGGIRVIYRHVDILNAAGINTFVLHQTQGFRCDWFSNRTPVRYVEDTCVLRGDLLIVPEVGIGAVANLCAGIRYAIFNQNSHLTWRDESRKVKDIYRRTELAGVITVSKHNMEMLRFCFPDTGISRVRLSIDPKMFYNQAGFRPKRISYMPRRGRDDAAQVLAMLDARGGLDGWEVKPLHGLSHEEVAEELRHSRIFLAFTHQEGFGLPAAEAMASGCYVIGNHGFGGREFFNSSYAAGVQTGDVVGFAYALDEAIRQENAHDGWCAAKGAVASQAVLTTYSEAHEISDVVAVYTEMLQMQAAAA